MNDQGKTANETEPEYHRRRRAMIADGTWIPQGGPSVNSITMQQVLASKKRQQEESLAEAKQKKADADAATLAKQELEEIKLVEHLTKLMREAAANHITASDTQENLYAFVDSKIFDGKAPMWPPIAHCSRLDEPFLVFDIIYSIITEYYRKFEQAHMIVFVENFPQIDAKLKLIRAAYDQATTSEEKAKIVMTRLEVVEADLYNKFLGAGNYSTLLHDCDLARIEEDKNKHAQATKDASEHVKSPARSSPASPGHTTPSSKLCKGSPARSPTGMSDDDAEIMKKLAARADGNDLKKIYDEILQIRKQAEAEQAEAAMHAAAAASEAADSAYQAAQAAHLAADAAEGEAEDDADLPFEFGTQMFATPQGAAAA